MRTLSQCKTLGMELGGLRDEDYRAIQAKSLILVYVSRANLLRL